MKALSTNSTYIIPYSSREIACHSLRVIQSALAVIGVLGAVVAGFSLAQFFLPQWPAYMALPLTVIALVVLSLTCTFKKDKHPKPFKGEINKDEINKAPENAALNENLKKVKKNVTEMDCKTIVTDEEYDIIIQVAIKIKNLIIEKESFYDCANNIDQMLTEVPSEISKKIKVGVISNESYLNLNREYYGVTFRNHFISLLKKENGWYVVDPYMGVKLNCVAMKANEWLLKIFTNKRIVSEYENGFCSFAKLPKHVTLLRILKQKDLDPFRGEIYLDNLDKLTCPISSESDGQNMLNLSEMIDVFNGNEEIETIFSNSKKTTAEDKALQTNFKTVYSYFDINAMCKFS